MGLGGKSDAQLRDDNHMILRRIALAFGLMMLLGAWYIDPGSGSLLWQLVLSSALGVMFSARRVVTSLVAKFLKRPKRSTDDDGPEV